MSFENAGSTIMSLLVGLAGEDARSRTNYLQRFAIQYTQPLVDYLCRAKRHTESDAVDLVQSFWLSKLLEPPPNQNLVARYLSAQQNTDGQRQASFRLYLLRSISNHALDQMRRKQRLDVQRLEELDGFDPISPRDIELFDVAWANKLLRTVVNNVQAECKASNQSEMWQLFLRQIIWPRLNGSPPPGYAELAESMGFRDARSASNAVRTVIRKFQSHMRQCIRDYLPANSEAETELGTSEEFQQIMSVLSKPGSLDLTQFTDLLASQSIGHSEIAECDQFSQLGTLNAKSFVNGPEQTLYVTDNDIAARWQQLRQTSLKDWFDSLQYPSEGLPTNEVQLSFDSLAKGDYLPDALIIAIRDAAKSAGIQPGDEPVVIYSLIYMLAIANGFMHHGCLYSSDSVEILKGRAQQIVRHSWIDPDSRSYLKTFINSP